MWVGCSPRQPALTPVPALSCKDPSERSVVSAAFPFPWQPLQLCGHVCGLTSFIPGCFRACSKRSMPHASARRSIEISRRGNRRGCVVVAHAGSGRLETYRYWGGARLRCERRAARSGERVVFVKYAVSAAKAQYSTLEIAGTFEGLKRTSGLEFRPLKRRQHCFVAERSGRTETASLRRLSVSAGAAKVASKTAARKFRRDRTLLIEAATVASCDSLC